MKRMIILLFVQLIFTMSILSTHAFSVETEESQQYAQIQGYLFYDTNHDGIMQKLATNMAGFKINLWQNQDLIATLLTPENGYYQFDYLDFGKNYSLTIIPKSQFIPIKSNQSSTLPCTSDSEGVIHSQSFILTQAITTFQIGFVKQTYELKYSLLNAKGQHIQYKDYYEENEQVQVIENDKTKRKGYHFIGWNTQKDGQGLFYQAKDTFLMPNHALTLYAIYQKDEVKTQSHHKQNISVSPQYVQTSDDIDGYFYLSLLILATIAMIIVIKSLKKKV